MKHFYFFLIPFFLSLGCTEPTPTAITIEENATAAKNGPNKIDLCHILEDGSYKLISLPEPALPAHLDHGDGKPGDPVLGKAGFVFDDSCVPVIAIPTDGLIAYYPFNGNANDESSNGNDGVVNGAILTEDRYGNNNSAYRFEGSSFIEVASSLSLENITSELTITAWVKKSEDDISGFVVAKRGDKGTTLGGPIHFLIKIGGSVGYSLQFFQSTAPGQTAVYAPDMDPYANLNDGNWHFIAVSHRYGDGSSTRLYLNDQELVGGYVLGDGNAAARVSDVEMFIGKQKSISSQPFIGTIDDLRIYNRALTESEILSLFNE